MDKKRSTNADDYQELPRAVTAMAKEYLSGDFVKPHSHKRAQLLYATSGIMRVSTKTDAWIVPPQRAVWLAPGVEHKINILSNVSIRTIYVSPGNSPFSAQQSHVLAMSPLIRELILRILEEPPVYDLKSPASLCAQLLLEELPRMKKLPLHLPLSENPRLTRVCNYIIKHPNHSNGLDFFAELAAVSSRTLERMFINEFGMTFGKWRQQAKLCEAVARLSHGEPVSLIAHKLGYASPSAFSAMFKKAFGLSPTQVI